MHHHVSTPPRLWLQALTGCGRRVRRPNLAGATKHQAAPTGIHGSLRSEFAVLLEVGRHECWQGRLLVPPSNCPVLTTLIVVAVLVDHTSHLP